MEEKTDKKVETAKNGGLTGLTSKEIAFSEAYLVGETKGNATASAVVAGYVDAHANGNRILNRLKNNPDFLAALEAGGLSTYRVAKVTAEAMAANYINVYKGEAFETAIPDHRTRIVAAKLAAEITDMLPDRQSTQVVDVGPNLSKVLARAFGASGQIEAEFEIVSPDAISSTESKDFVGMDRTPTFGEKVLPTPLISNERGGRSESLTLTEPLSGEKK